MKSFFQKNVINNKPFREAYLTDFISGLIAKNYIINAHGVMGNYIEIDTVEDIESPITQSRIQSFKIK